MGILGLSRLIADIAPEAIREVELKSLFGRRIAIDASMSIYQFLIAIRNRDQLLTNESGETTSHLIGLFYRTIKLLEIGLKPVYVFDGKAPQLKCGELTKRAVRRKEAEDRLASAKEEQDLESITKFNKRVVRVTRQHNDDCKKLLKFMGLPVIESPSEAEAQCAQLCKEGLVYATATEDMDGLTFGSPRLVRNLTTGNNDKIKEYYLEKVLAGLGLTHNQFIDLGILMGCDYCDSIRGIGGKKGLELIKTYGSIEQILEKKFGINEFFNVEVDYGERREVLEVVDESEDKDRVEGEPEVDRKEVVEEVKTDLNGSGGEDRQNGKQEVDNKESVEEVMPKSDESVDPDNQNDKGMEPLDEELIFDTPIDSQEITESQMESDSKSDEEVKDQKKKSMDKKGTVVPENWLFIGARKLFTEPNVLNGCLTEADLKQKDFDEEAIVQFLCVENGFSEERVKNALKRVKESKGKSNQSRIDSFFKTIPNINTKSKTEKAINDKKNKKNNQQSKGSAKRGRR